MALTIGTASGTSLGGPTPTKNTSSSANYTQTYNPQTTVNPNNVTSPTSLGVTTPTTPDTPVNNDPYSAWGGQQAYNNLVNRFDTQKDSIFGSSLDAAKSTGVNLRNSILDFIDALTSGQQAVDNRGIDNELAKQRGTADVYGGVSRGLKSAGTLLANRNAGNSSAGEGFARAYGQIGQRQLSDIGNQYETENQDIGLAQEDLLRQRAAGLRRIEGSKEQAVTSIVSDAADKLAALDAAMANADLPDRIALDAEKNKIKSQVLAELGKYDNRLGDVNNIKAMGMNDRVAEATRRRQLGQAPANAFSYSTETPMEFKGTGPFASSLPIFSYRSKDQQV